MVVRLTTTTYPYKMVCLLLLRLFCTRMNSRLPETWVDEKYLARVYRPLATLCLPAGEVGGGAECLVRCGGLLAVVVPATSGSDRPTATCRLKTWIISSGQWASALRMRSKNPPFTIKSCGYASWVPSSRLVCGQHKLFIKYACLVNAELTTRETYELGWTAFKNLKANEISCLCTRLLSLQSHSG
jgi:hypothetical protein